MPRLFATAGLECFRAVRVTIAGCSPTVTARGPLFSDASFESVCERCGFFETGPQFVTILRRQRKHADERGQSDRSQLFDGLIEGVADAQ